MNFVAPKIHRLGGDKMLYVYNEAVQRWRKIYRMSFARAGRALDKRSEFSARRVKFRRNFGAKQRELNFKICISAENR